MDDPVREVERAAVDAAWRAELAKVRQEDTSVELPPDGGSKGAEAVSEELTRDLAPDEVVLKFDNSDYLAMMEAELRRLDEHGMLDGLAAIVDDPERFESPRELKERAAGLYNTETRELYIAPEEIIGEEPRERQARPGFFSTEKNFGSVWHELGHHRIRVAKPDENFDDLAPGEDYWGEYKLMEFGARMLEDSGEWQDVDDWFDPETVDPVSGKKARNTVNELIEEHVSEYAIHGTMEFVAETHAGKIAGNEYPEKINDLYVFVDGPPVPEAVRDPSTAYEPMVAPSASISAEIDAEVEAAVAGQTGGDPGDPEPARRLARTLERWGAKNVEFFQEFGGWLVEFHTPFPGDQPIRSSVLVKGGVVDGAAVRYGVLDDTERDYIRNSEQIGRLEDAVSRADPPDVPVYVNFGDVGWHDIPRPHVAIGEGEIERNDQDVRKVKHPEDPSPLAPAELASFIKRVGNEIAEEFSGEFDGPDPFLQTAGITLPADGPDIDRRIEDAAAFDDESVEDVLDELGAMHVREYEGIDYYAIHGPDHTWVVVVEDDYAYADPFEEWIYDSWTWDFGLGEWLDYQVSESFEENFWRTGGTAFHVTEPENAARIIGTGGIQQRRETRGTGNQSIGGAVFLSQRSPMTVYGDVTFEVDVDAMKEDGFQPDVSMEPAVLEARQREAIASQFLAEDFWADYPHDVSEDTVIFHSDIPIKYLSVEAEAPILDEIEEYIRTHASGDDLDAALEWLDRQRSELPQANMGTLDWITEKLRDHEGITVSQKEMLDQISSVDFRFDRFGLDRPTDTSNFVFGPRGFRYHGGLLRLPRISEDEAAATEVVDAVFDALPGFLHEVVEVRTTPQVELEDGFHYPHVEILDLASVRDSFEIVKSIERNYQAPSEMALAADDPGVGRAMRQLERAGFENVRFSEFNQGGGEILSTVPAQSPEMAAREIPSDIIINDHGVVDTYAFRLPALPEDVGFETAKDISLDVAAVFGNEDIRVARSSMELDAEDVLLPHAVYLGGQLNVPLRDFVEMAKEVPGAYYEAVEENTGVHVFAQSTPDLTPPSEVQDVAQDFLDAHDEGLIPSSCATEDKRSTGYKRAEQLAAGEELSPDDITGAGDGMFGWFQRHDGNQETDATTREGKYEDCGYAAWRAWGGDPAKDWVEDVNAELQEEGAVPPAHQFDTKADAEAKAEELGCSGAHQMPNGKWMPCGEHATYDEVAQAVKDWQDMDTDVLDAPAGWSWAVTPTVADHLWGLTERSREVNWGPDPPILLESFMGFFPDRTVADNLNNWYLTRIPGEQYDTHEWHKIPVKFRMPEDSETDSTSILYAEDRKPHPLRSKLHAQQYTATGAMFTYEFAQWQGEEMGGFMRIPVPTQDLLEDLRDRVADLPFDETGLQTRAYRDQFAEGPAPDGTFFHPHFAARGATEEDLMELFDVAVEFMERGTRQERGAVVPQEVPVSPPEAEDILSGETDADLFHVTRRQDAHSIALEGLLRFSDPPVRKNIEGDDPLMEDPAEETAGRWFSELMSDAQHAAGREDLPIHEDREAVFFWETVGQALSAADGIGFGASVVGVDSSKIPCGCAEGDAHVSDSIWRELYDQVRGRGMADEEQLFEDTVEWWQDDVSLYDGGEDSSVEVWCDCDIPPEAIEWIYDPTRETVLFTPTGETTLFDFEAQLPQRPETLSDIAEGVEPDPMDLDPDEQPTDGLTTLVEAVSSDRMAGVPFDAKQIDSGEIQQPWKPDVEVGFAGHHAWASVNARTVLGIQAAIGKEKGFWSSSEAFLDDTIPERMESLRGALSGAEEPERGGIPPVVIRIGNDGNVIAWQEGRHRAIAALEEGIDRIPVKFVLDESQPGDIPPDAPVDFQVSPALSDLPPGRDKAAAKTVVEHARDWAHDIDVLIAGGAAIEFYPNGFPRPEEDYHDNPSVVSITEDGLLGEAIFRYGFLEGDLWDDSGVRDILDSLNPPDGTGEVKADMGDFADIARPHLIIRGNQYPGNASGGVDWEELMDFAEEFGDRLRDEYDFPDVEAQAPPEAPEPETLADDIEDTPGVESTSVHRFGGGDVAVDFTIQNAPRQSSISIQDDRVDVVTIRLPNLDPELVRNSRQEAGGRIFNVFREANRGVGALPRETQVFIEGPRGLTPHFEAIEADLTKLPEFVGRVVKEYNEEFSNDIEAQAISRGVLYRGGSLAQFNDQEFADGEIRGRTFTVYKGELRPIPDSVDRGTPVGELPWWSPEGEDRQFLTEQTSVTGGLTSSLGAAVNFGAGIPMTLVLDESRTDATRVTYRYDFFDTFDGAAPWVCGEKCTGEVRAFDPEINDFRLVGVTSDGDVDSWGERGIETAAGFDDEDEYISLGDSISIDRGLDAVVSYFPSERSVRKTAEEEVGVDAADPRDAAEIVHEYVQEQARMDLGEYWIVPLETTLLEHMDALRQDDVAWAYDGESFQTEVPPKLLGLAG